MFKKIKKTIAQIYDPDLLHYSSSLSFHTLLSIIPILLISFSIFLKLPNFDEYYMKIKNFIFSNLLPSHQNSISRYIENFLENSSGLGIMGFVAIIFTSVMFFSDYENIVCKITKTQPKSFWHNLSKYWTLMTLAPMGLVLSFYVSNIIQNFLNQNSFTSWINFISILPYLIIWVIFAITYEITISASSFKKVLFSSFCASLCWSISKLAFVEYAFYNKTYMSLYGSFSILLFFFLWIYIGWTIFLYGLKLCWFMHQENLGE